MVNLLPLKEGETISTVMPLPEDETTWGQLNVMFATTTGTVRRNDLSDFVSIYRNGKIAMKLDGGDRLVGVGTCDEGNDVLLNTRQGKCIRFQVADVRVFTGRNSVGVRGIKLADGDEVISMSILKHVDFDTDSRNAYLRMAKKLRGGEDLEEVPSKDDDTGESADLSRVLTDDEFQRFAAQEEYILTATLNGFGKRTSAYEYRVSGRGGSGITSIATSKRNGEVVASFPVRATDQIMMITDAGRLIRMGITDIRIAGRSTQGVTLFSTGEEEKVTSVAHLPGDDSSEQANGQASEPNGEADAAPDGEA